MDDVEGVPENPPVSSHTGAAGACGLQLPCRSCGTWTSPLAFGCGAAMDACCFGSETEHSGAVTFDSSDPGGIAWALESERSGGAVGDGSVRDRKSVV